jgi:hypothetical protein
VLVKWLDSNGEGVFTVWSYCRGNQVLVITQVMFLEIMFVVSIAKCVTI